MTLAIGIDIVKSIGLVITFTEAGIDTGVDKSFYAIEDMFGCDSRIF